MRKLLFLLLLALPLAAQQPCVTGQPLPKVPEIVAQNGFLRGTITVASAQQMIPFRTPPTAPTQASTYNCYPQWVRVLRGSTTPAYPSTSGNSIGTPMPGPTLRARVGDLVQLTLVNLIDPNVFPYSIDQGEKSFGCDQTTVYPANAGDQFPNCFHGSSTVNIHFHGSHTNPNATGDNVFLELRPSPRTQDQANAPVVNADTFKSAFDDFFKQCESILKPADPLIEWPTKWTDLPTAYTQKQEELLKAYDASGKYAKKLWPVDARQIAQGAWAQYYIGAYPYCWRIPQYTQTVWPPVAPPVNESVAANMTKVQAQTTHTHGPDPANTAGAGTAEAPGKEPTRILQMGQSPGTHWYHAHKHGSTAINVSNGMTGAFIMEGQYDDDLNAFYGAGWTRTQPLMVINQLGVAPNLERGGGGTNAQGQALGPDKGPGFAVNGQIQPVVTMAPGEVQMWRIVNTSSRAGAYLSLPTGFQWRQISQDGVQLNNANYTNPIFQNQPLLLMPGNRADMLVMAPAAAAKTPLLVQNVVDPTNDLPTAAQVTMLTINVTGTPKSMKFIPQAPQFPPFLADIKAGEVTGSKVIRFSTSKGSTGASDHFIDHKQFSGEVGEVVLLNTVEEWKVVNETYGPPIAHPFHIHINPFQVVEVFDPNETIPDPSNPGKTLPMYVATGTTSPVAGQCAIDLNDSSTWKPCVKQSAENALWWDVFAIPSGKQFKDTAGNVIASVPGYFKMRSRFVDYAGYYVLHCHILAHEDRGMMTIVEVAPLRSPYSHH